MRFVYETEEAFIEEEPPEGEIRITPCQGIFNGGQRKIIFDIQY
jgi:hypothetical protein